MFKKSLGVHLQELAKKYPIVTLLGPRQSGKTTLVKMTFPHKAYINMEEVELRPLINF